jgi:hypothetical protein
MVRLGQVRKIHDLINTIWTNQKPKAKTQRVSRQGNQTIPYLLTMTTLKIIFYKNIKSILVLVNHHFLIWGGVVFFFTKTLIMKMNVMISRMSFLILNKYWECHGITEYLKNYSWSKHVKQINEFLMAMRNMWWRFRFLFGQTNFLSVRQLF